MWLPRDQGKVAIIRGWPYYPKHFCSKTFLGDFNGGHNKRLAALFSANIKRCALYFADDSGWDICEDCVQDLQDPKRKGEFLLEHEGKLMLLLKIVSTASG